MLLSKTFILAPFATFCKLYVNFKIKRIIFFCFDFSEKTKFNQENVKTLEEWIDSYHMQLPSLRNFILPVSVNLILLSG